MKRRTEKPSEEGMQFFTPDLYLRVNSPDDAIADRADEDWESALARYRKHLARNRDELPAAARKLSELCLHDAEVLAFERDVELGSAEAKSGAGDGRAAILSGRQGDRIWTLIYALGDPVRTIEPENRWPFSKERKHWLYEELDVVAGVPGRFVQRILFSDGAVAEIPFVSVMIHDFTVQTALSRQIA